jgi:multidrug efflux pump subunit AcrA (membrane-fusion protein)
MQRTILIGLVVVAGVSVPILVRRWRDRAPEIGKTATVTRGAIQRIVVATGSIEPEHLVEVRAKVSGIVERFHVDAGDRVKTGQVVAGTRPRDARSSGAVSHNLRISA